MSFSYRGLECKSRKSKDTWSNRKVWSWSTKWDKAKDNRVLTRELIGHRKRCLPSIQETNLHMYITKLSVLKLDWLYSCSQRWRSSIQSAQTRLGAVCGSDHEHLIAKFRLKLKKEGKTTRSFRYDPHQIPYNYTVEVTNRFNGINLIDRVPEELWTEVCDILWEAVIKTSTKKKKCKKAKWLAEELGEVMEFQLSYFKP